MNHQENKNQNLLRLSISQGLSDFGKQVTGIAIPLIAILTLNATPFQLGILRSLEFLPFVTIGLFAGIWIDKFNRRNILISAKLGNALVLLALPLSVFLGKLSFGLLLTIALLAGTFAMFYELGTPTYLPTLTGKHNTVKGYSNLAISKSIAEILGPGLGGWAIQLITAPFSVIFDTVSSILSSILLMKSPMSSDQLNPRHQKGIRQELIEGFGKILKDKYLRPIVLGMLTANFFDGVINSIVLIYLTRNLLISPAILGAIFACGSMGGFLGAFLVSRINNYFGFGMSLIGSAIVIGLGRLLIPLAGNFQGSLIILITAYFLTGFGFAVYGVNLRTISQANSPNRILGRVFSVQRFIAWGTLAIGLLLGGIIAYSLDLRTMLFYSGAGLTLSSLWIALSPIRTLRFSQ